MIEGGELFVDCSSTVDCNCEECEPRDASRLGKYVTTQAKCVDVLFVLKKDCKIMG